MYIYNIIAILAQTDLPDGQWSVLIPLPLLLLIVGLTALVVPRLNIWPGGGHTLFSSHFA